MSAYPLSPHRRQSSTNTSTVSSLASAYTANFTQATNTTEPSSVSSRASWMPEKRNSVSNVRQALAALETSTPNAASADSTALSRPPPLTTNPNRHSFHDTRFLREEREKREQREQNALLGSPLSPSTDRLSTRRPGLGHTHASSLGGNELVLRDRKEQDALESPSSPPPVRSLGRPRLGHTQTASLSGNELSSLKHSSVSHFRTLSQISAKGASEFAVPESADVAGMHGRKRLQRAPTDQMSSWERMNWMDKRRKYIQAYEYLCHIGEAKE
jgi:Ras GTPase-activating-like protein IQGAP2/3